MSVGIFQYRFFTTVFTTRFAKYKYNLLFEDDFDSAKIFIKLKTLQNRNLLNIDLTAFQYLSSIFVCNC